MDRLVHTEDCNVERGLKDYPGQAVLMDCDGEVLFAFSVTIPGTRLGRRKFMECPYCKAELEYEDFFGRIGPHQDGYIAGDIYRCPNGAEQDGSCESGAFSVAGSFYTYRDSDGLHEGYPC